MDILQVGPHTSSSSVAISWQLVTTSQDINDEAQAEGVTSFCPCCLIPRQSFCSVIGSGGRYIPDMNIDRRSRIRDNVGNTTSNMLTLAGLQARACFLIIVDISMT
jgi:hypothetical protein